MGCAVAGLEPAGDCLRFLNNLEGVDVSGVSRTLDLIWQAKGVGRCLEKGEKTQPWAGCSLPLFFFVFWILVPPRYIPVVLAADSMKSFQRPPLTHPRGGPKECLIYFPFSKPR